MTTNVHTFQLAAVLIEAAEDEGQKKEAVIQRVKNMFSNAVKWLKEKLAKLIDFLKEKELLSSKRPSRKPGTTSRI